MLIKGDKTGDVQLQPGDVLYIPPAGPQVALLGSVRQPCILSCARKRRLAVCSTPAGGTTVMAASSRISIDRIADHAQRIAFELTDNPEGLAGEVGRWRYCAR
ncbi:MAG: hypothetical protein WDM87_09895 [Terracidiphilus sp.]